MLFSNAVTSNNAQPERIFRSIRAPLHSVSCAAFPHYGHKVPRIALAKNNETILQWIAIVSRLVSVRNIPGSFLFFQQYE